MALADSLNLIPHTPTTATGTGLLPPFLKTAQHLIYLTAMLSDEEANVTQEAAIREITDARGHWTARSHDIETHLSTSTVARLGTLDQILDDTIAEYPGWDTATATRNLIAVSNRFFAVAAILDRELTGLQSDPGSTM